MENIMKTRLKKQGEVKGKGEWLQAVLCHRSAQQQDRYYHEMGSAANTGSKEGGALHI